MANANPVPNLYKSVVDDVINNVREAFLDDGCDEQILQELKQLWDSKLQQSKAIEPPKTEQDRLYAAFSSHQATMQQRQQPHPRQTAPAQVRSGQPVQHITVQQPQPQKPATVVQQMAPRQVIPRQVTPQQHIIQQTGSVPQQIPIVLNADGSTLQLSTAAQQATVALPAGLYQQQINQLALQPGTIIQGQGGTQFIVQAPGQLVATQQPTPTYAVASQQSSTGQVTITQGGHPAARPFSQTDGANDSTSEDDDDDDRDDDDDDDDNDKDEDAEDDQGEEEDPLNSDDDVSDPEPAELFDTDNVVVCQYDKINRAKNRWKFHLKDGIMNLNGRDHVFQRANGEAEW